MFTRPSPRLIAAGLVLVAVVGNSLWMGRAVMMLNVGLVASYLIWVARGTERPGDPARLLPVYLTAIALQCLHFCEEYWTGFQHDFPHLVGYEWSDAQFVTFNLVWLAIFILAAVGVYQRVAMALVVVWFFGLAGGIANGAAHLALTLVFRRYFPGTVTAPLVLLLGIILVRRLLARDAPLGSREAATQ